MKRFSALFFVLGLILSSCIPNNLGNVNRPFRLYVDTITARPGTTIYVHDQADPGFFKVSLGGITEAQRQAARVGQTLSSNNVSEVFISDAKAPSGWIIDLESKRGVREITAVSGPRPDVSFTSYIDLVFSIRIPANVAPGVYTAEASVSTLEGQTKVLPMRIEIIP
ncbi:MAG: hypothetical protein KC422_18775 [Trueperaceae bacterium]|nr:hypothetical protein [Trueperaceae bacterium]